LERVRRQEVKTLQQQEEELAIQNREALTANFAGAPSIEVCSPSRNRSSVPLNSAGEDELDGLEGSRKVLKKLKLLDLYPSFEENDVTVEALKMLVEDNGDDTY